MASVDSINIQVSACFSSPAGQLCEYAETFILPINPAADQLAAVTAIQTAVHDWRGMLALVLSGDPSGFTLPAARDSDSLPG